MTGELLHQGRWAAKGPAWRQDRLRCFTRPGNREEEDPNDQALMSLLKENLGEDPGEVLWLRGEASTLAKSHGKLGL